MFIPRKEYKLELGYSKECAFSILKTNITSARHSIKNMFQKESFWGLVNEEDFELHYCRYGKPSTVITGSINDGNKECILDIKITIETYGKTIMFGGLIICALIFLFILRNIIVSGEFSWEILIPLCFSLYWYFILRYFFIKKMIDYTVKRIEQLLK